MVRVVMDLVLVAAAVPLVVMSAYLCLLAVMSRRANVAAYPAPSVRFDVIVPAHDEESGIGTTVRSVLAVDYPANLRRVIVVADNCTDRTAERAADSGALVWRRESARRGKGYALANAFERSLGDGFADAVVIVDADSVVCPRLLLAFAARIGAGAHAIQAYDGVRNPDASWRTRLMAVAFSLCNGVRSLGRERLRCSTGLHGNGMCLTTALLREIPYDAFSVVEDLEYGIRLVLSGHRVHYAEDAVVLAEMVADADASESQRWRWEGGRFRIARQHAWALLRRAVHTRDRVVLDTALDLFVPPLAYVVALATTGSALTVGASLVMGAPLVAAWAWASVLLGLGVYVVRGWWLSQTGWKGFGALLHAPVYLVWKLGLLLHGAGLVPSEWTRTRRGWRI